MRSEGEVIEPLLPWIGRNALRLAAYLLSASVATAVVLSLDPALHAGDAGLLLFVIFLTGGLYSLPGAVIWILVLSRLSPDVSARRRKTIAVITAPPSIGIVWIVLFWSLTPVFVLIYGVLFPAGSGLIVRLRERSRARSLDLPVRPDQRPNTR